MALNQCLDWETESWIRKCIVGEEAMTCDKCFDGEIQSINSQLRYLTGDVTQYESCWNLKTSILTKLKDVELDLEALVIKLQTHDLGPWQTAFTQYNMDCSYIPTMYCPNIVRGSAVACEVCQGQCQNIENDCPP